MALEFLAEALRKTLLIDPLGLTTDELAGHTLTLQRLRSLLDAADLAAVDATTQLPVHPARTFRKPQQWITFETQQSATTVGRKYRVAGIIRHRLPAVWAALAAGKIQMCHVDQLMRLADRPELAGLLERDIDQLVKWAAGRQYVEFRALVQAWAEMMDPTDPQDIDDKAYENRQLAASSCLGETHVELAMPTIVWEQIESGYQPLYQQFLDADWADAHQRLGDAATGQDLARTDSQRSLDAIVALMRAGIGAKDPGATAIVNIIVDEQTLCDQADRQTGHPVPERPASDAETRRCETSHGQPITPSTALTMALSGHIRRITYTANGVTMSSKQRLFRGNLRQAILIQHRWCDTPGCETPSHHCEIDHTIPTSRRGPTNALNGKPKCRPCHRHKTRLENLGIL